MRKAFRFFLLLASLGVFAVAGVAGYSWLWYHGYGKEIAPVVLIKPGTGFRAIAEQLHQEGLIEYPLIYTAMVAYEGKQTQFKAGEYHIPYGASPQSITELLVKGESIIHSLTFPEGLNVDEVIALINADPRLTGGIEENIPEGSLMPDTYHFHRGDRRQSVIQRMQQAQITFLNEHWPNRDADLPYETLEEVITLASIVEKETGVDKERGRVAAVFVNRLRRNMPLQSDPTVVYGIEKEHGPMERQLLKKDLKQDHSHNTYTRPGLPPTPIANPGKDAIRAVLNPPETSELYFVATGKGGHYFAKSLKEHNRNVAKYRRELRAQ